MWIIFAIQCRIDPFPTLFWALGIVLVLKLQRMTQPAGLASLNRGIGTVLYGRGQLGSIWRKKRRPQPFSFLAVLTLWDDPTPMSLNSFFRNKYDLLLSVVLLWHLISCGYEYTDPLLSTVQ